VTPAVSLGITYQMKKEKKASVGNCICRILFSNVTLCFHQLYDLMNYIPVLTSNKVVFQKSK
jgi:hypothetical protein